MENQEIIRKLKSEIPEAVLETQPFGRSGQASVWIESKSVVQAGKFLRDEVTIAMDWLENLSAMEIDGAIVLTYFLRSSGSGKTFVLRATLSLENPDQEVDAFSVAGVWPMAEGFEREIGDLFGVRFGSREGEERPVLAKNWVGYPLRKSYVFPTEYLGIPHMRPVGRTIPDEFEVIK